MRTVISAISMALASTAAMAQDISDAFPASDGDAFYLVGGSLSFGTAYMSQQSEFDAFGPSVAFGLAGKVGTIAGSPLYLEWAGYLGRAYSHASNSELQGPAPLLYTSSRSPSGTIDLSTFLSGGGVTSDATVLVTDSTGDTASIFSSAFSPTAQATAVSQFAVSQTDSGGIFAALTTNGQTGVGSAYGAVFDDTGFLFLGTGDNSQTAMTTSIDEKIIATNQTLFLSTGFSLNEQWTVSPRLGPTFRDLERVTTTRTTIDLDEGSDLAANLPNFTLVEKTSLKTEYYGAILGADFAQKIREDWLLNLGVEAGVAKFSSRSSRSNALSVADTNVLIPGRGLQRDGTATIVRIAGDLTHRAQNGAIITFSAYLDYLSDAPYVTSQITGSPAVTGGGSNVVLTGNGETFRTYSIESRSMISAGISLSAVFLF